MRRNKNIHEPRPALAVADRVYFSANPEATFRIRDWELADAECGTLALDGLNLAGATLLVFRCGCRIPMAMRPGTTPPKWLVAPEAFAEAVIAMMPELGWDWP